MLPTANQLVPSVLYSHTCDVKPVPVRCVAYEMSRFCMPAMLNANTIDLPFARKPPAPFDAPPTTAKHAVPEVVVDSPDAQPVRAHDDFPDLGTLQGVLELDEGLRKGIHGTEEIGLWQGASLVGIPELNDAGHCGRLPRGCSAG